MSLSLTIAPLLIHQSLCRVLPSYLPPGWNIKKPLTLLALFLKRINKQPFVPNTSVAPRITYMLTISFTSLNILNYWNFLISKFTQRKIDVCLQYKNNNIIIKSASPSSFSPAEGNGQKRLIASILFSISVISTPPFSVRDYLVQEGWLFPSSPHITLSQWCLFKPW